jgi:hypothetical protein
MRQGGKGAWAGSIAIQQTTFDRDRVPFCVAIESCRYEKAGAYKANGTLTIAFFTPRFRVSRALTHQAMH